MLAFCIFVVVATFVVCWFGARWWPFLITVEGVIAIIAVSIVCWGMGKLAWAFITTLIGV